MNTPHTLLEVIWLAKGRIAAALHSHLCSHLNFHYTSCHSLQYYYCHWCWTGTGKQCTVHSTCCTTIHTHNHFTALWTLFGTTWVSQYQKVHFAIFWIFWCKMKITQADAPTIRMDCHPIQTNLCPHLYHPHHFYTGCLPDTTLPIYPGLGETPNMLACIPGGLVLQQIHKKQTNGDWLMRSFCNETYWGHHAVCGVGWSVLRCCVVVCCWTLIHWSRPVSLHGHILHGCLASHSNEWSDPASHN